METFLTGAGNNDELFSNQNGCSYSKLPRFVHGKKVNNNESFTSVEEDSSDILVSEGDGSGSEMDITEDYPSETRAITRKDSTFCVPLIRVEDWSFSESDMEDDLEDSLPPFSFVGTKEKVKVYSVFIFFRVNFCFRVVRRCKKKNVRLGADRAFVLKVNKSI